MPQRMASRRPSDALLALLAPLPSLDSFGAPGPCNSHGLSDTPVPKRQKKNVQKLPASTTSAEAGIPRDIAAAVDSVRRAGAPADTLFFAGLPAGSDDERFLRSAIPLPVREVKLLHGKQGKKVLAWASFFNEADCVAALVALRRNSPALKVRLHTPRAGSGVAGPGIVAVEKAEKAAAEAVSPVDQFAARADKIVGEGGLANSVMLRGMPLEVSIEELTLVLLSFDASCRPLRVRTSEGKSGKVRNFWMTYASREAACSAFVAMHGRQVSFRCGKTNRLVPVVHNDATDAESKVRRGREAAMAGNIAVTSTAGIPETSGGLERPGGYREQMLGSGGNRASGAESTFTSSVDSLGRLEDLLLRQPGKLFFLSKSFR